MIPMVLLPVLLTGTTRMQSRCRALLTVLSTPSLLQLHSLCHLPCTRLWWPNGSLPHRQLKDLVTWVSQLPVLLTGTTRMQSRQVVLLPG